MDDSFEIKKDTRFDTGEKLMWNILQELKEIKEILKNKPSTKEELNKCIPTVKKDTKGRKR